MKISLQEINHLALLARLKISKKEQERYSHELSAILDYVEKLNELPIGKTEPIAQITGLENITRNDQIKNKPDRKRLLRNAPVQKEGFIKVKSILD